jgi:hypothetical protein
VEKGFHTAIGFVRSNLGRPRFGLRLLLIIIALAAVCSAYLRARLDLRKYDIERVRSDIETQIELLESRRVHFATDPNMAVNIKYINIKDIDGHLQDYRKKLAELEQ